MHTHAHTHTHSYCASFIIVKNMYFLTGPWNINESVTFTHFGLYCIRRNITLGGYKSRGETLKTFTT